MKALAIRQPFAWQIVQGIKVVEYRSWPTHYQGPLLIHATKQAMADEVVSRERSWLSRHDIVLPDDLPGGGIVGVVRLADCVRRVEVNWWRQVIDLRLRRRPPPGQGARPDSIWFGESYGFVLRDARPLRFEPLRGQQKLFDVPDDLYGTELEV